jgi:polysaccharide pyruvyl transferase WcaK-like protein
MTAFILPRYILGNRGDLASRWGVLRTLHSLGAEDVTVFRRAAEDVPPLPYPALPYRPLKNLLQDLPGWRALRRADAVLWAVGLDMQDDSSLARLLYLWGAFRIYRLRGLKIVVLFQGAGPLSTRAGRAVARQVLKQVDTFVARDPGTYALIGKIHPDLRSVLAHDAIFLPGFEEDARAADASEQRRLDSFFIGAPGPVVGLNIRQWFHFSSGLFPYQLAKKKYQARSLPKMAELTERAAWLIEALRRERGARVLLISAYQPGILPWEDDLDWLVSLKRRYAADENVILTDGHLSMPGYYAMMSRLDLMIGMRLHSSLIALRFGVPAMNLSYTLKGGDIMNALGLDGNVVDLGGFLQSPQAAFERAAAILSRLPAERETVRQSVELAVTANLSVMRDLLTEKL